MEEPAFPSDTYAIKTQIAHHGLSPRDALILARPRNGEFTVQHGRYRSDLSRSMPIRFAVIVFAGVNFFTGQLFDIERITAAHRQAASSLDSISPMPPATCR